MRSDVDWQLDKATHTFRPYQPRIMALHSSIKWFCALAEIKDGLPGGFYAYSNGTYGQSHFITRCYRLQN